MLMIRLFRTGRKNQPAYKVVVTEKTNAPARGRFVEEVGFYNPLTKEKKFNAERITYWISVGAQPSDTVHNMLVKAEVIKGDIIPKHKKSKKPEEEADKTATEAKIPESETKTEEAPAPEEKKVKEVTTTEPEEKKEAPVEEKKEEVAPQPETKKEIPEVEKPAEGTLSEPEVKEEPKKEEKAE